MNNALKLIGYRIQEVRKAQGLSQNELAERLNISPSHMSNIETGRSNFGIDIFQRITEVLQVSADSLLRSNVPEVTNIYSGEIIHILQNCTPEQAEQIKKILKDIVALLK